MAISFLIIPTSKKVSTNSILVKIPPSPPPKKKKWAPIVKKKKKTSPKNYDDLSPKSKTTLLKKDADWTKTQGTIKFHLYYCSYSLSGNNTNTIPLYQKLLKLNTHIWSMSRLQPEQSAIEGPHPRGTTIVITVNILPGKYDESWCFLL